MNLPITMPFQLTFNVLFDTKLHGGRDGPVALAIPKVVHNLFIVYTGASGRVKAVQRGNAHLIIIVSCYRDDHSYESHDYDENEEVDQVFEDFVEHPSAPTQLSLVPL